MKHVLIGHVNGQPYYYDHPNGQVLAMSLGTKMSFTQENTGDLWQFSRCEKSHFLFSNRGELHFLILSDQGDSVNYLR